MKNYYQGKFKPKNPTKYKGDASNIVYRSSWELATLKWLDTNSQIKEYCSEEVVVPYFYEIDKSYHRYFVDLKYTTVEGETFLVEIKPDKQTRPPVGKRKTKQYVIEATTYVKNQCKWKAAEKFAKDNNYKFVVWTEHDLQKMGIMPKPLKPLKPYPTKK